MRWSKRSPHCGQRTSSLVPLGYKGSFSQRNQNAKPLPTVRESELRPRTSVNAAIGRLQGFLVLNQDSTETLARLAARKADGVTWFE